MPDPVDERPIVRFIAAMGYERGRYRSCSYLLSRSERYVAERSNQYIDGILRLPEPYLLHYGDVLPNARVAYRLVGPADAPVVAVLGGISAHRMVAHGAAGERGPGGGQGAGGGWWPQIVGPGLGVDTIKYRVLGLDYLGGGGESSTPGSGEQFPPLNACDQAAALHAVVEHLGLKPLHAIVGASYGGMVALCFAATRPMWVNHIVVLSAADKSQLLSTAWRSVQRQIVREAIARGDGAAGLKLARALAMATYRSAAEFDLRFAQAPIRAADRFRFPIEDYLFARGDDYVQKYRPESFLALSESIDLHHMDASRVHTPSTLIAVREDQLVPFTDMQSLAARLAGPYKFVAINSIFGHDAFLKEATALIPVISNALAEARL